MELYNWYYMRLHENRELIYNRAKTILLPIKRPDEEIIIMVSKPSFSIRINDHPYISDIECRIFTNYMTEMRFRYGDWGETRLLQWHYSGIHDTCKHILENIEPRYLYAKHSFIEKIGDHKVVDSFVNIDFAGQCEFYNTNNTEHVPDVAQKLVDATKLEAEYKQLQEKYTMLEDKYNKLVSSLISLHQKIRS